MPDKKADPKDVPLGSGLLGRAKSSFLNRRAQIDAAVGQSDRAAKLEEKNARKAPYVPK